MKKIITVWMLSSVFLVSGCSSTKTEEVSAKPTVTETAPAQSAKESPVDLGASSAGRGL